MKICFCGNFEKFVACAIRRLGRHLEFCETVSTEIRRDPVVFKSTCVNTHPTDSSYGFKHQSYPILSKRSLASSL